MVLLDVFVVGPYAAELALWERLGHARAVVWSRSICSATPQVVKARLAELAFTPLNSYESEIIPCPQASTTGKPCRFRRNLSLSGFLVTRVSLPGELSLRVQGGLVSGSSIEDVAFRYMSCEGSEVATTLSAVAPGDVADGLPVRRFGSYARMGHYPGWWWSATMSDLVGYESLLERDRLMLADFDRDVVAVASQPFGITGLDGDVVRRHVPDYLLLKRDGSVEVVDVKPARLVDKPKVAEVLGWTGRVLAGRGWRYSVWSGAEALRLTNVRFLAQGRRAHLVDVQAVDHLHGHGAAGRSLGEVFEAASHAADISRHGLRAALLFLLWRQVWEVCLDEPLGSASRINRVREVCR